MDSPYRNECVKARGEEIETMKERRVWDLVNKPGDPNILGCRWVYTIKRDE